MAAAAPVNFVPIAIACFVAYRVFRRVQRNVGAQLFRPGWVLARAITFVVISCLLSLAGVFFPKLLLGLAGGLVLGAGVGFLGLWLTKWEVRPEGRFYRPNTYLGVAVSTLLIIRLAYRLFVLNGYMESLNKSQPSPAAMQSALTFFVFGILAGYYITYYAGIYIHGKTLGNATGTQG